MLTPKIVELNTLIHEVQPMLQRLIGEDIELHTSLAAEASYILADPGQVEQVVINLAVNARDAMPGGGHLTLETATVTFDANDALQQPGLVPGNYVGLVIRDTGTGMSEQVKHHLFEPFFTTKEQGRGTGLGLATCYGIVKQSGGHIAVESELGHGTAFHIFLPRQEAPAATPGTAAAHEQLHHGTETILVAEDDEMVRELIVTTLRGLGYHVLEAENGMAALALVEMCGAENIQLLLTDVVMPGMSGKLLADRVRDLNPQIKILFCSGYTDDTILQHRIHELQAVLLPKPFNSVTLAQQVAEVLHAPAVTAAT
jgi:CheY-like chemotaxis protein